MAGNIKVDSITNVVPTVGVKARAQKDRILLRWAVSQPFAWRLSNKYGFEVYRITVARDEKALESPETVKLTNEPLKPKPEAEWMKLGRTNKQAAIIAQGLYGKTFNVGMENSSDISSIIAKTEELDQRYTFSLMSADQNFEAAQFAGWGMVDSTAKPNERYVYRVFSLVPEKQLKITEASAYISLMDFDELPAPIDIAATFGDKTVMLSWNYEINKNLYSNFFVERSEDSVNFAKVTETPITNLITRENPNPKLMNYADSLAVNDKMYWYRVRGMSSFGEEGLPSKTVKGMGEDFMAYAPNIHNFDILADSSVRLDWHFPEMGLKYLDHFALSLSDDADGTYKILEANISATARTFTVKTNQGNNYLILSAIYKKGKKYDSYPQFVQLNDATPPAPPTGLKGEIDSSGYISLSWTANKEKDFHGYYVFRCNVKGEEMSLMNADPLKYEQFCDSVDLKMLNSKVFYAVVALDKRYNKSGMSTILEIVKPDMNPPVAPVFTDYKLEEEKVILSWMGSSSEDVEFQRLYKKDPTDPNANGQWSLVKEFETRDSITFTDDKVKGGATVSYALVSVDKSKNESTPSTPLTVVVPMDKRNKAAVKDLKAQGDRQSRKITLDWVYDEKGVAEYQVYKTLINQPYALWKVLDKTALAIEDSDVSASNVYKYAVRAVFNDGTMSVWREVKVEF